MLDHVTLLVSDLAKSKDFYSRIFAPLGFALSFGEEQVFWAFALDRGLFEIAQADPGIVITPTHIAFRARSEDAVRAFHAAALSTGARDNGAPGPRPQYTKDYFAAFVLDPDGHNIEAMHDKWEDRI